MQRIVGAPNAYESSFTLTSSATLTVYSEALFVPSNLGGMTLGFTQKSGANAYATEVTMSTAAEVKAGTAEWHRWEDIDGLDSSGWMNKASLTRWIPIPSAIRFVLKLGTAGNTVYFGIRGQ